ncbi:hypothetical protein [Clostridium botulinum]|uniref:Phage protein n=1 Tax=Clostridium botulinum CFSAN001627 TaxID=1232189 RepID=M1ZU96_CLOBO|nr:hypothetical protein [Clostridium botulinum]EKN42971.1 hypothetical protein CFSAN001627_03600 [Clostridium botulinum CFSAN001627]AXG97746.1 hypothetical protein AGE31_19320 [Clostridium botulinum]MBY6773622.1 hypothetical protein [Clostridium botulinum]MBY6850343.1 hypothetical protein [Clostridium botulinum]MBY6857403.1 hypothetical protein [Clostridium botulinum]
MRVKKSVKKDNSKKLKQAIERIAKAKIKIGIFGDSGSDILMIANVNEFGCNINVTPKMRAWLHYNGLHLKGTTTSIKIPERSFVRRTAEEKQNKINKLIQDGLNEVFTFQIDVDTFLNRVGQYLADLMKETLTEVSSPPNHSFTIERKGGKSNPLIDTGRLRESITFKI